MGMLRKVIPEPAAMASPVGIIEKSGNAHYTGEWDVVLFQAVQKGVCIAAMFCHGRKNLLSHAGSWQFFLKKY